MNKASRLRIRVLQNLRVALRRCCCALLGLALALQVQAQVTLPDLGGRSEVMPPEQARSFPREFRNYMRAQGVLVEDPLIEEYISDMGYRLVMHSDGRDQPFHFFVLNIPEINAFAAPAGVIAMYSGLILAARSQDEVAGVLAHEVSHVTQNHLARGLEQTQQVSMPLLLATFGLVLAGSMAGKLDGDVAAGVLSSGVGLAQQAQINYTRQNEAEADRIGIQLLARAGYDPNGMASFFETLNQRLRALGSGPPEYLRSHPMTVNRLAEARERAEKLVVREKQGDERFGFIQARLRVLGAAHPDEAADWFTRRLSVEPEDAWRYGLALADLRRGRFESAEARIRELERNRADDQLIRLLEAELRLAQGQWSDALALYQSLYRDYGASRPIVLAYAEALLHEADASNAGKAAAMLRELLIRDPEDLRANELLALAAARSGDAVRAAEAQAMVYYQQDRLSEAVDQLRQALKRPELGYYDRSRLQARLDQWRVELLRTRRRGDDDPERNLRPAATPDAGGIRTGVTAW
ncbi:MAG: M48 family metalloprotease [Wenzhouxiangellaceae bacterium]